MKTEMITSVEHLGKHQKGSRVVGLYTHDAQHCRFAVFRSIVVKKICGFTGSEFLSGLVGGGLFVTR